MLYKQRSIPMAKKPLKKKKIVIIACIVVVVLAVATVAGGIIAYEMIFGMRYQTEPWLAFTAADYDGLIMERSDFDSDGVNLAGYKYSREGMQPRGVVVIAHGLGSGGHNNFMPFIDIFTSNDYYVFSYDAHGNGESGGKSVEGLPQGLIDLDKAICHAETIEEYAGLPFMLFGHSWGAYSSASALNLHPEIAAAVVISGFNETEDMLTYFGSQYIGPVAPLTMPILEMYERVKFGAEYTDLTGVEGLANTDARIMIVHSADDETVPIDYGYDTYYEEFSDSDRFEFVRYEDRGHGYLFCSDAAEAYRDEINAGYTAYIEENGLEYSAENKEAYMVNFDKKRAFEPDMELVEQIIAMFDEACA